MYMYLYPSTESCHWMLCHIRGLVYLFSAPIFKNVLYSTWKQEKCWIVIFFPLFFAQIKQDMKFKSLSLEVLAGKFCYVD